MASFLTVCSESMLARNHAYFQLSPSLNFNRDPWITAQERYLDGLSDEHKALYKEASVENLFYSTSAAQFKHEKNSKSRAAAKKLQPLIAAITQYGGALDVLSNTSTLFFSPIWGGLRVLLHIAGEFDRYYSRLIDMLERIGDVIPRFKAYERLFPNHEQLLYSLSVVYLDIINFCVDAKNVFQKVKNRKRSRFSFPGSGLRALKVVWKPFDQEFGSRIDRFRMHSERVDVEAQIAHMAEQANENRRQGNEREAQALERHAAAKGRERQLLLHKEQAGQNILQKLSLYEPEYKHRIIKKARIEGTGRWMLDSPEFVAWLLDPRSSCLWCYGIPGSGKTIVSTTIIDSIIDDHLLDGSSLIWFYCDYSEQKTLDPSEIVGSLIKQLLNIRLLEVNIDLRLQLEKIYDNDRIPDLDELFDMLLRVISKFPKVFIIIDGLDECKEKDRELLFPWLKKLHNNSSTLVKLMITSRDEVDIRKAIGGTPSIQASKSNTSSDLAIVVEELVKERLVGQRDWLKDPCLVQEIIDALVDGAEGMFIWVRFQLDDICEELSEEGVRNALKCLPHGLKETFIRAMKKITLRGQTQVSAAKKLFMWLSCAKRVLSLEEMQEAVAILPHDKDLEKKRIPDSMRLLRACGSLIIYDSQEHTIRFAHYSVQQFLSAPDSLNTIPEFHFSQAEADIEAGRICMTYLNFSAFQVAVATYNNLSKEETRLLQLPPTQWVPQIANFSGNHPTLWNLFKGISGSGTDAPTINFNEYLRYVEKPSKNLMDGYKLLDYVIKYWCPHTALIYMEVDGEEIGQFRELAFERKLFFKFRPWGEGNEASHMKDPFIWALENSHETLVKLTYAKLSSNTISRLLGYNEHYWSSLAVENGFERSIIEIIKFIPTPRFVPDYRPVHIPR
ncbi:uncharacterized protein LAJ45_01195 [Morchella importuna]|uniref:uncharacterized protein n=1 Tax=Morchella importuna TaxID=1174673 RepID=UPI001E8E2753|nr:uncharacterized protein LAJ45_01195 [Morchella importuna]KAH8154666.1 hypothetical protein LAJ45_01195 [Morchella importuna]